MSKHLPKNSKIDWIENNTPYSHQFDDAYFDKENGLEESRHVFLAGNGLPERFESGFHIAELGFGTGLNLLAALYSWRQTGQSGALRYTSFEAFPLCEASMRRAICQFAETRLLATEILEAWNHNSMTITMPHLSLQVIVGDARDTLPKWNGKADAWFLDGFAPRCNPELWEPDLLKSVAEHTVVGGTFATYSAAGSVRRSLADAGFSVERCVGHGRKKHMCRGKLEVQL